MIMSKANSLNMFAYRENKTERQKYDKLLENPEADPDELALFKPKKESIYVCFATDQDKVGKETISSII